MEQLKEHQASQQTVSQSLTSQSQAMLNLNLKLQSTVAKGQVKTIDLELKKLDALQAVDQIAIMKVSSFRFTLKLTRNESRASNLSSRIYYQPTLKMIVMQLMLSFSSKELVIKLI